MTHVTIGFVPLTDCAPLVAAWEKGFAKAEGLNLELVRDVSWATARDRVVYGQAQCAHLLAPLAVAVSLGIGGHSAAIAAPFKLSVNGNAITFSHALSRYLQPDPAERITNPAAAAARLKSALTLFPRKPVLAVVHRFSGHALALRYWLASAGIDPDRDVTLRVLPPSFTTDALASGEIDGFTAGEPWNTNAVEAGVGQMVALNARIWESGPEKVLAMRTDWAEANPDVVDRLLRAIDQAARWCDAPENRLELAALLADARYVGRPANLILPALEGKLRLAPGEPRFEQCNFMMFHCHAANFPWRSQALWIYSQFVRWGWLEPSAEHEEAAAQVFRSDIYRRALSGGRTPLPSASSKVEGSLPVEYPAASDTGRLTLAPDRFFDGHVFDPARIGEYLAQLQDAADRA